MVGSVPPWALGKVIEEQVPWVHRAVVRFVEEVKDAGIDVRLVALT